MKLTECLLCYCGEIWQMVTLFINIYCPKASHRIDDFICIIQYHRRNFNLTSSSRLEPTTVFRFVALVLAISFLKQFFSLHHSLILSFTRCWIYLYQGSNPEHFMSMWPPVPVISFMKWTNFAQTPFFSHA